MLDNCPLDRAQTIALGIVNSVRDHRFPWAGRAYRIGVSIGLVTFAAEARYSAQLLTQADVACCIAKDPGRNRVHVYPREDRSLPQPTSNRD